MQPSSILARNNDAWLTTKIKTQMLTDASVPGSRIKVSPRTASSTCWAWSPSKRPTATNVVQSVSGVQKIVKLFEYID
jgi:osmotically-inducible protein OsmY